MYTILLVEDEKWVRTAICKVIEKTGLPFRIEEAANGMEALDRLMSGSTDLVFTDIRMPVMDGLALANQIKDKEIRSDIIIVSGYDEFAYARQAIQLGVFDYLLKPVEQEEMESCLQKWLNRKTEHKKVSWPAEEKAVDELSPVEQVIFFIKQSMPGDVSLKQASKAVHLNASYLSQLFKERTGKNFNEYVTEQRMNEAEQLLKRTSLRISEIAGRLGYADLAYFTNAFKKFFGVTPSTYRKRAEKL
ncbi:two-component system, sensor histidine kinase YesM [Evansella caseinilytica]|uniref:Two-component system, sensor histidine kinase YesM n=1 Tax=Evansella caseinilytica TaxID=1503961 RepID=A0A1H3SY69_9BACI|nr:response regulator [Evansella caseinilytica]SDZ42578.1 two-component system, sensor histidine kinase YesM [Evansella caseinilytica]